MAQVMDLDKDQRGYTRAETSVAGSYDPNGVAPVWEDEPIDEAVDNIHVNATRTGVYSLLGNYLGEDAIALPAGVYIINGKKVVK